MLNNDAKKIIDQMRVKLVEVKQALTSKIGELEDFLNDQEMMIVKLAQSSPKKTIEEPPIESEVIHSGTPERS